MYYTLIKNVSDFPVPSRGVTTKLYVAGNNLIIPSQDSLVSDIPAGDGKIVNLFLQCTSTHGTVWKRNFVYSQLRKYSSSEKKSETSYRVYHPARSDLVHLG